LKKAFKADIALLDDIRHALSEVIEKLGDSGAIKKSLAKFNLHTEKLKS
jgi:hypothetical protein